MRRHPRWDGNAAHPGSDEGPVTAGHVASPHARESVEHAMVSAYADTKGTEES
ncbi:hypothetical protein PAJL_492 [Cutibacterium acnes HL042PA3]|nr:hypothetical protein HMPREF9206_2008 [Cutibacterium acnes J139]ESK59901.1 hypothetical protein PAJL_492 [Cutibacterium acnes HL042PA3]